MAILKHFPPSNLIPCITRINPKDLYQSERDKDAHTAYHAQLLKDLFDNLKTKSDIRVKWKEIKPENTQSKE